MPLKKGYVFNILLCLNCILLLFALAGNRLHVPLWLQVLGRMHPLFLHFPIVLLVLYILWSLVFQSRLGNQGGFAEDSTGKFLLLATAFSAVITALMGILLAREEGYDQQALAWHKWSGVTVSLLSFGWYSFRDAIHRKKYLPRIAALFSFCVIVFTGHQGSVITHGENYLLAPVMPEKSRPSVPIDRAVVYADVVRPVLEAKCMNCHNSRKAKGQLVMESELGITKGGKHGLLFSAGHPELSLLLQRVDLPEADKKHMPPAGKPQLDNDELAMLYQWIKDGASFKQKVIDLPPTDSMRILAEHAYGQPAEEIYTFSAAAEKDIAKLNNANRQVHAFAQGSPALSATFYNRQTYTTAALKELLAVKAQLVSLNLAYMPLKDEDLGVIGQFPNLQKLNLNFTSVPGNSIAHLNKLLQLKEISLAGAAIRPQQLLPIAALPKLKALYVWNTAVTPADKPALTKQNSGLYIETGSRADTVLLKLNPPVVESEERIVLGKPLPLKLRHYIKGVTIRYTIDGSTPDSSSSPIYNPDLTINDAVVFKARAFKPGWKGSDSIAVKFYKDSYPPDTVIALAPLDSFYKGEGAKTIANLEKGDNNYRTNKWLGFRKNPMVMIFEYKAAVNIKSVTVSSIVDIGSSVMPPVSLEIWGGLTQNGLAKLAVLKPPQPDSLLPANLHSYDLGFRPSKVKYLKIVAVPVAILPPWHPFKGKQGWFFADEVFVN